jgi:hypothetical protein
MVLGKVEREYKANIDKFFMDWTAQEKIVRHRNTWGYEHDESDIHSG